MTQNNQQYHEFYIDENNDHHDINFVKREKKLDNQYKKTQSYKGISIWAVCIICNR